MERITKNNPSMLTEAYKCLIENQIESRYTADEDWAKFINSMDRKTYEKYVDDAVECLYSFDNMWVAIDDHIEYCITAGSEIWIKNIMNVNIS